MNGWGGSVDGERLELKIIILAYHGTSNVFKIRGPTRSLGTFGKGSFCLHQIGVCQVFYM